MQSEAGRRSPERARERSPVHLGQSASQPKLNAEDADAPAKPNPPKEAPEDEQAVATKTSTVEGSAPETARAGSQSQDQHQPWPQQPGSTAQDHTEIAEIAEMTGKDTGEKPEEPEDKPLAVTEMSSPSKQGAPTQLKPPAEDADRH